jgi:hypothetical protein
MGNVLSRFDTSRKSISKAEYRTAVSFIQFEESGSVTSSCLLKQKFFCGSLWQSALDSAGIASYLYYRQTAKGYGLPLKTFLKTVSISNNNLKSRGCRFKIKRE